MPVTQDVENAVRCAIPSRIAATALLENKPRIQIITATNTTIAIKSGVVFIAPLSGAMAIVLPDPVNVIDDGNIIEIIAVLNAAHTVTSSCLFNATGGTATFGGARGDSMILRAYNAVWWTSGNTRNVSFS